jgi:hypothetical protein
MKPVEVDASVVGASFAPALTTSVQKIFPESTFGDECVQIVMGCPPGL